MPLIKGRSLAEILRTLRAEGRTAMPSLTTPSGTDTSGPEVAAWPVVVARLGLQAAEALEHAHSLGVIHRDIKPSNLIVDAEERLWVTDFGLARITRDDRGPDAHGRPGGDPAVHESRAGPRRARAGRTRGPTSMPWARRSTRPCTLRPVFEACDRSALCTASSTTNRLAPRTIAPTVPKDLETIVLKAMDKLPTGRYATARDLADDLRRFLEDRPIRARRRSLVERSLRWSKQTSGPARDGDRGARPVDGDRHLHALAGEASRSRRT